MNSPLEMETLLDLDRVYQLQLKEKDKREGVEVRYKDRADRLYQNKSYIFSIMYNNVLFE